ncbi:ATP-binding protein [Streptomyces sp. NBC_01794]|uniref:ATP-binding protein n=1 Tax=Streptomyces sp. NBC_01794 TaxID=2975942 RepID=UPI0030932FCA|nr:ATP-binding protein [Streptomyces sp. NBC_01794]
MTRRARILVPGDPSAVAFARNRVITQVRAWDAPLDEEKRYAVGLVVSELVTNAIAHAEGLISVGLYLNEERLLLVVHDGHPTRPRRRRPTTNDETGRGLALVAHLATRTGWDPTPNGKKVWAEFDVLTPPPTVRGETLRRRMKAAMPRTYITAHVLFALAAGL